MREEVVLRSLLLVDADANERRQLSAVASRAGWSTVGAADDETAVGLLQGPHGREVRAALLVQLERSAGTGADRRSRAHADQTCRSSFWPTAGRSRWRSKRCAPVRPIIWPSRSPPSGCSRRSPPMPTAAAPPASWRPCRKRSLPTCARPAGRRRARVPLRVGGRRQSGAQPPADPDRRRAGQRQGNLRPRHPSCQPARQGTAGPGSIAKRIAANIIDSELFGHMPGAFPGAFAERVGRMVEADNGTLLLDEVGSLPKETQARLDRVLATGEVRPVGCNGSNSIDVRVIATSSRPLAGRFPPRPRRTNFSDDRHHPAAARSQRRHSGAGPAPA